MKSFKCEVQREDEFRIEFDENVIDDKWMSDFRQVFYDFNSLEEHAEHIAQARARFGKGFIEGYGIPLENGQRPPGADSQYVNRAINIIVIDENYCEVDVVDE